MTSDILRNLEGMELENAFDREEEREYFEGNKEIAEEAKEEKD